ncbi:MAG: 50S ribosomal protein L4 [Phycisphaerales bacterium]|jgi:large subunit ribosomal protein L4|nr:50S ribosomal protein L4 [PVC group bacterium]MDP6693576.1 50S ribosomal protein L4 [Phycisphaerales bacterium]
MIELPIYNREGKKVDSIKIDEVALGSEVRPTLLKQAYVRAHSNRRQGSSRTKSRGMVDGSTRKIYRQKGTGNARMGTVRTNIRKGGGVTFAKTRTHENFRKSMPKKMRQLANRNALLAKLVDNEVKCIVDLEFETPKTRDFKAILDAVGVNRSCLVAVDSENRNAAVSARNLKNVDTIRVDQLNVFELLNHRYLVVDKSSIEAFLDGSAWNKEEVA